ncbi:MAG: DUF1820 family protein [Immundisolibacteraceae bacterium]|nr:DUF1820 family protein [Immundisolibacteraceae bacterium]
MSKEKIFKVCFMNQGKVYELHAREVSQSGLFGFIEIGDFVFDEASAIVIDPSEEKLRSEFAGVRTTFVPMHSVIRIDEVEKRGNNKIRELDEGAKVTPFPSPIYTPGTNNKE